MFDIEYKGGNGLALLTSKIPKSWKFFAICKYA